MQELVYVRIAENGLSLRQPVIRALYKISEMPIYDLTDSTKNTLYGYFARMETTAYGGMFLKYFCDSVELINSEADFYISDEYIDTLRNSFGIDGHTIKFCIYSLLNQLYKATGTSYDPTDEEDYVYTVSNDEAHIIFYKGTTTKPIVPSTLSDAPVTTIESTAFVGTNVEKVKLPDGITTIK